MNGLVTLFQEFVGLMDPSILGLLLLSTLLGVIIGALPGLSATMGIALLTGLTYKFPIAYTFAILMGVYVGAIYGGSMSAILLNIPGTASAAATALEGHPLAMGAGGDSHQGHPASFHHRHLYRCDGPGTHRSPPDQHRPEIH